MTESSHEFNARMAAKIIRPDNPDVIRAYNDAETLAEFGEWCALRLFGDTPETVGESSGA